jgi:hypothetical protein
MDELWVYGNRIIRLSNRPPFVTMMWLEPRILAPDPEDFYIEFNEPGDVIDKGTDYGR